MNAFSSSLARRPAFAATPVALALTLLLAPLSLRAASPDAPSEPRSKAESDARSDARSVTAGAAPGDTAPGTGGDAAPAGSLRRVEVSGRAATPTRQPGDRNALSLTPAALPAAVQHLGEDDIAATNIGRDISNVFRRVPGVLANNIDQGETGNGFRMRGFATQGTHGADTAVYVDGVPQNVPSSQGGAGHGPVFLEWLTGDMIGGIDVVKGPISALYGDQNRAGAVDIRTRDGGAATPSSLGVSVERFGLRRASLVLSNTFGNDPDGRLPRIDSLLVADVYRNDGYRRDSRTDRDTLFWKLGTRLGDARYSLRFTRYLADFDAAGYLLLPDLERGLDPRSTQVGNPGFGNARRTTLVLNRAPADGDIGWHATAYAERFDRTRGIATSATQHTVGVDHRDIFGGRVLRNWRLAEDATLAVGAEARADRGDAFRRLYVNRAPTANYLNAQDLDLLTYGVFTQAQWRPVSALKLSAGARYDRFDYDIGNLKLPAASTAYRKGSLTPKLGASWSVSPSLELFANVAQGMRSPAAEQISGSGAAGPLGAPGGVISQVAPSKVRSYDAGFTAAPLAGWTVSGTAYYIQNDDEITGQADGSFKSVGDTTRKGVELETRWQLAASTSVYASLGRILEATVNNPAPNTGAKLSVPGRQFKAGAQHRFALGAGRVTLNADAYYLGDIPYYVGTPTIQPRTMPAYTRYDLRATYDWASMQATLYAVFQPQRFGSEIAYGSAAGLMLSPVPRTTVGASLKVFF
ncbi:TonB-dependent receptor [Mitsuaria sp. GD03876]|uniref:TonB-dependent receptor n=1 Tax=Mitsuaria sp. GD03876 TaxID=2975399 RepID=UPI00244A2810|nr:TonB-dependent receptor [Mitsuaria sp. GD03876]MDH0867920.1 TonB-dependent receptor [Mitsuaria sp. GD03876]